MAFQTCKILTLQTASAAKSYATDVRLKEIGWYDKLNNVHERDAARHALLYLTNYYKENGE
jgi:hypothetical protein